MDVATIETRVTLGDLLKRARRDAGLDQQQLGDAIGVSNATISKWELDKSQPTFANVRAIIEATNSDWLLTEPFRQSARTRTGWFIEAAGGSPNVAA